MKPRHSHQPPWSRLSDRKLLALRFRDLKLRMKDVPLRHSIDRLYAELARAGLQFRPHYWLAEEWFSPDGVPGIAIPFYLAHPHLRRLERRMMREVEGGNANWLMRILRHEAGHALDTAFRLRQRSSWQAVFGSPSRPYPDSYRPRPGSRRFVQHLGAWYAQSHPTEDFAETFAVWLQSRGAWKKTYREWPALRKLRYVDDLMRELRGRRPLVRRRLHVEPLDMQERTLEEHYRLKRMRYAPGKVHGLDASLRRIFTTRASGRNPRAAATFVRSRKTLIRRAAAARGAGGYLIHQVLRLIVQRCEALDLYLRSDARTTQRQLERLVARSARLHLSGTAGRHRL